MIEFFNSALEKLHRVKIPTVRPSNDGLRVLFHRNDPIHVQAKHDRRPSPHIPYVVLVSLAAAQDVASDRYQEMQWDDAISHLAPNKPSKNFTWPQILSSLEFKSTAKQLKSPPFAYSDLGEVCMPKADMWESFDPDREIPGATSAEADTRFEQFRVISADVYPGKLTSLNMATSTDIHRQRTTPMLVS